MFERISIIVLGVAAMILAGCQNTGSAPRASYRSPSPAVVCDQCKTTWVQTPVLNDKGRPVPFAYTSKKATVCPECERAAKGYFDSGKLKPCQTCGGTMQIVEATK